jgi:hypothetical protein
MPSTIRVRRMAVDVRPWRLESDVGRGAHDHGASFTSNVITSPAYFPSM